MTRKLVPWLALVMGPLVLQGCFPIVATGVGASVLMADDRRTTGIYIEDENIEWKVFAHVRELNTGAHVSITSFNRKVLLTGEANSDKDKAAIEAAAKSVPNVREVVNELQIAGASSLASRGNDSLITSNVKARMVNNGKFAPNHVKVVTEAGVVYLMGLVTQAEGEAAVEIARTTSGVNRVVKVFEYIPTR